ncbi:hypothetical protein KBB06_00530 [Candidatus Gracilibacteria bacterium]|nr:hypothetical protein [Candidatus Gracilibacteria bacterium]
MPDLFSQAQLFLTPVTGQNDPERQKIVKDLETLLQNSPFYTPGEKQKMAAVIPSFTNAIILDLQQTLIRQNLRYLQSRTSN